MSIRDNIRTEIFKNAKPLSIEMTFFGAEIELKQPSMKAIMDAQSLEDKSLAGAMMVIRYAFVPGTNDRVFDDADIALIQDMPFGSDMALLNENITKLTGIDIEAEVKNSEGAQDS